MKSVVLGLILCLAGLTACSMGNEGSGEAIAPDTLLAVVDNQSPIRLEQVATGQPNLVASQMPTRFEAVEASPNCRMPTASQGAKLAYVYTYGGGVKTPLHYIADGEDAALIAERMARTRKVARQVAREGNFVQAQLARSASAFFVGNTVEWATRVDVLVTETEAPVFLVLTSYDAILWNIQTAPGVRIDGIVVSAYEGGAIANGVDTDRTGFMGFDGSPNRACRLEGRGRPVRPAEREASARELNPNIDLSSYRQRWQESYRQGNTFFSKTLSDKFGARPSWIVDHANGESFQAVLLGPVPSEPFEQQPIVQLQIPSYVEPFWGKRKAAFEYFGLDE